MKNFLLWTPRIAGILFILFISLFALDVFDPANHYGPWETAVALFMHLIPSIVLAIAIALAWKWEWVGALAFIGWAVVYVIAFRGFDWSTFALIVGTPFAVGALFLWGWIYRKKELTKDSSK
jgi:hypothetical protein